MNLPRFVYLLAAFGVGSSSAFAQGTGGLAGRVTSSAGNAPVAGADVVIELIKRSTQTRAEGSFTLDSLPTGEYNVIVRKIGFSPTDFHVAIEEGRTAKQNIVLLGVKTLDSVTVNESNATSAGSRSCVGSGAVRGWRRAAS